MIQAYESGDEGCVDVLIVVQDTSISCQQKLHDLSCPPTAEQ
jgi:hypothetical protein